MTEAQIGEFLQFVGYVLVTFGLAGLVITALKGKVDEWWD